MAQDGGPFRLTDTRLVLGPGGTATPKRVTGGFYQQLDAEFGNFAGHMLVAEHSFDAPWPTWEVHPEGDEFVYLLEGDTDFVLWIDASETRLRVDTPGSYVIVPKGIWHTARPRKPTRMLFVTPGEGTRNAARPDDTE